MELDYFRLARDRYFVPLAVKIPGSEIELARHGGAESTRLDFIGEIKDAKGATVANVRDNIQVKLKGESGQQLSKTTLEYDTGFTLGARRLHGQVSGARKRNRKNGHVRNQVCGA